MPDASVYLIVIPTYNEIKNIENLVGKIEETGANKFDILFVDDNSPDGTGRLIDKIRQEKRNIFAIHRAGKMGLGSAYLAGFQYAVRNGYERIFEMDADLSHDPKYLKLMLEKLNEFDIVIGSRFLGRLSNINATPFRIITSILASSYLRILLGLKCSDPMGGFVGYKRRALESLDYSNFIAKGYGFQAEIKYKCAAKGFTITEFPIVFKQRGKCDSKLSKKDVLETIVLPWKIR